MDMHTGQQRRFPAVAVVLLLFTLCIIAGQFLIAELFPSFSGFIQITPDIVFLDIPVRLPVAIDLIIAPGLFLLLYPVVILFYPSGQGTAFPKHIFQRIKAALGGLFVLLCCILAGGLLYYLVQDYLSPQIRNGINSFGINADIHLSYLLPGTIYLRGSMILFLSFVIGLLICIRKIRKEPKSGLTREQRMTPFERMMQEKRVQEKHSMPVIQKKETKKVIQKPGKDPKPADIKPRIIQSDHKEQSGVCYSQPVYTLRPEATYYLPV